MASGRREFFKGLGAAALAAGAFVLPQHVQAFGRRRCRATWQAVTDDGGLGHITISPFRDDNITISFPDDTLSGSVVNIFGGNTSAGAFYTWGNSLVDIDECVVINPSTNMTIPGTHTNQMDASLLDPADWAWAVEDVPGNTPYQLRFHYNVGGQDFYPRSKPFKCMGP